MGSQPALRNGSERPQPCGSLHSHALGSGGSQPRMRSGAEYRQRGAHLRANRKDDGRLSLAPQTMHGRGRSTMLCSKDGCLPGDYAAVVGLLP